MDPVEAIMTVLIDSSIYVSICYSKQEADFQLCSLGPMGGFGKDNGLRGCPQAEEEKDY